MKINISCKRYPDAYNAQTEVPIVMAYGYDLWIVSRVDMNLKHNTSKMEI